MFDSATDARHKSVGSKVGALACLTLLLMPALERLTAAELKAETLHAWDDYVSATKERVEKSAKGELPFLRVDEERELAQRVRAGELLVEPEAGQSPLTIPRGLIHDWSGTVFLPDVKLDDVMHVLDDYSRYPDFYKNLVTKAKLLEQSPDREKVTLLMMQKVFSVTAAVEIDDDIQIKKLDRDRAYTLSNADQVREISDFGTANQHPFPEGHGPGYVWRTLTITRLEQRDGGVYAEMEIIAMSRGIPFTLRWLIKPLAERVPRSLMLATLRDTRDAVRRECKARNGEQTPGGRQ